MLPCDDQSLMLVLMTDAEIYSLVRDVYADALAKHKKKATNTTSSTTAAAAASRRTTSGASGTCLLVLGDEAFEPILASVLALLRHSQCRAKALDILNLVTLLLVPRAQAELKRLLKWLYLTVRSLSLACLLVK